MHKDTFATAINCMDGRTQRVVADFLKDKYQVDWVDAVTEPGPDKILSDSINEQVVTNIQKRVEISVKKHGSKTVVLVAHDSCAGNPVSKEEHTKHLKNAKKVIEGFGLEVEVILLYVAEGWQKVEIIQG